MLASSGVDEDKGADTEVGRFMRAVMARVGAKNPTDLSKALGGEWTQRDPQRKLYKWWRGEAAPNFESTITLIRLAGWLTDEGEAAPVLARPAGGDQVLGRLELLAADVAEIARNQTLLLEELGVRGTSGERGAAPASQQRARPRRRRQ